VKAYLNLVTTKAGRKSGLLFLFCQPEVCLMERQTTSGANGSNFPRREMPGVPDGTGFNLNSALIKGKKRLKSPAHEASARFRKADHRIAEQAG
jgi:hypothetical protein